MKSGRIILTVVLGCAVMGGAQGRPVDLSAPSAQVGSADLNGDLQLWREVDGVGLDMGKGSYLPLRIKFSTAANTGGLLGPGFYCPMFEARNVLIREQMMRAFLPCGKGLYLRRDTADPTKFQTVDKEWTGLLNGDDFVIWRDDGWKITYHKNRLTSIQTDADHSFDWSYNDDGQATGVSEDGQAVIGVESDPHGKFDGFSFGGKNYTVDMVDQPLIEVVNSQTIVGQMMPTLSAFHYPDGRTETYKVSLAMPGLVPTLDFTNADKQETLYTWDAASGHIATEKGPDGNWTYKVGDVTEKFEVPAISRTNDKGQTEGMALDNATGTYTATNLDGSTVITHTFKTPGPLFGKVHKVERIVNGQTSTIYQASYDEAGRLVRKVDENGFVITYTHSNEGKIIAESIKLPIENPAFKQTLARVENVLLQRISEIRDANQRDFIVEDLAFFYIHKMGIPQKALSLLPEVNNRLVAFNIQLHAIDGDPFLDSAQKVPRLEKLSKLFPEQSHLMEQIIKARSSEHANIVITQE